MGEFTRGEKLVLFAWEEEFPVFPVFDSRVLTDAFVLEIILTSGNAALPGRTGYVKKLKVTRASAALSAEAGSRKRAHERIMVEDCQEGQAEELREFASPRVVSMWFAAVVFLNCSGPQSLSHLHR